jgi:hypothetical protein
VDHGRRHGEDGEENNSANGFEGNHVQQSPIAAVS